MAAPDGEPSPRLTPGHQRLVGIFSPTLLDPAVRQEGLHLYDAYCFVHGADRRADLRKAWGDIGPLFPGFDETLVCHLPMQNMGRWPGTESSQTFGQTGDRRLGPAMPVRGLCLVGMDVQGRGTTGADPSRCAQAAGGPRLSVPRSETHR